MLLFITICTFDSSAAAMIGDILKLLDSTSWARSASRDKVVLSLTGGGNGRRRVPDVGDAQRRHEELAAALHQLFKAARPPLLSHFCVHCPGLDFSSVTAQAQRPRLSLQLKQADAISPNIYKSPEHRH
jgi:hypothetical protein